uniref:Brevican core protein n=1 Tax=Anas zonorhyncha TaxID=75864 RepID=A0A8B9VC25_9AVES
MATRSPPAPSLPLRPALLCALDIPPQQLSGQSPLPHALQVSIPRHPALDAVLAGDVTIPCLITYLGPLPTAGTAGRRAVLGAPRVKWTFISEGREVEILVARGDRVKVSEDYRLRASLPIFHQRYTNASLLLTELRPNDSGIYRCDVQHGIEDGHDILDLRVKGVVFHYREGSMRYAYTFAQAQEACARIGARIATPEQLYAAYLGGYEQCDAAPFLLSCPRYPIHTPREACYGDMNGFPGVRNYGVVDPEDMYDVYCYAEDLPGEIFLETAPDKFTLEEAEELCRARGAALASPGQLYAAWSAGLDACSPGWLADGSVRYPIVTPRERCGGALPGVKTIFLFRNQTGFPDAQSRYDAYCFREGTNSIPEAAGKYGAGEPEGLQEIVTVAEKLEELQLPKAQVEIESRGAIYAVPFFKDAADAELEKPSLAPEDAPGPGARHPPLATSASHPNSSLRFAGEEGAAVGSALGGDPRNTAAESLEGRRDPGQPTEPDTAGAEGPSDALSPAVASAGDTEPPDEQPQPPAAPSSLPSRPREAVGRPAHTRSPGPPGHGDSGVTPPTRAASATSTDSQEPAPGTHGRGSGPATGGAEDAELSGDVAESPRGASPLPPSQLQEDGEEQSGALLCAWGGQIPHPLARNADAERGHPCLAGGCVPNPCLNGGTCTEDGAHLACLCLPGYGGSSCERPLRRCSPGWDSFQGACYKHFSTRRSWEDAETQCRHYGGHLATILTPEEQDFINDQYREYQWIGLNDRTIEGDFQWSDGSPLLYENWHPGQPDSYFLSGENCVVIVWHDGGQWSDVPCNYHLSYTCKMGLVQCGPPPAVGNAHAFGKAKPRYEVGSTARYQCRRGFAPRRSPLIRCREDGTWEQPQLSCRPGEHRGGVPDPLPLHRCTNHPPPPGDPRPPPGAPHLGAVPPGSQPTSPTPPRSSRCRRSSAPCWESRNSSRRAREPPRSAAGGR